MTTLLTAARQALPGLEWAKMASQVCAKVHDHWAGMSPTVDGRVRVWLGDLLEHHATATEAAQWLRAGVEARRNALDAALGDSDRGAERQAAIAIAKACLDTGLVPQGVSGTVEAVQAVCDRAAEAEAKLKALAGLVEKWPNTMHSQHCCWWDAAEDDEPERIVGCDCHAKKIDAARAEVRRLLGVENVDH